MEQASLTPPDGPIATSAREKNPMWFLFDQESGSIYLTHAAIAEATSEFDGHDEKAQAVKLLLMRVADAQRIRLDPDGGFCVWRSPDREAWGFHQNDQGNPIAWPLPDCRH